MLSNINRRTTNSNETSSNCCNNDTDFETNSSDRKRTLSDELKKLSEEQVRTLFELHEKEVLFKTTISICETCLNHTRAAVFQSNDKVWLKKLCDTCLNSNPTDEKSWSINLIENDANFYRTSNKDSWGKNYIKDKEFFIPEYQSCCGSGQEKEKESCSISDNPFASQLINKSCTILVEVTNACNLACRVCYADASGDRILPFEEFKSYIRQLIDEKSFIDSIQVTGGEATIHPQFWDMVEWLYAKDKVGMIYLPTNGLEISKELISKRLAVMREKLLILLQFDGSETQTNQSLRRADTLKAREKVITLLAKHKICMQLTMTVAQDLSENEIDWVMKQGLKHKHIRLIGFLPTFYSGRYQLPIDAKKRPTLSTVAHAIVKSLPSKVILEDFMPIPCSHPNCGWTSLFARRFGILFNITQKIDIGRVMNEVAYKTILDKDEIRSVLDKNKSSWISRGITALAKKMIRPSDVFGIAIKPFMDRFNYDLDRVSNCCHHILSTDGELMSFCEYNTRFRKNDNWSNKPIIYGAHEKKAIAIKQIFENVD